MSNLARRKSSPGYRETHPVGVPFGLNVIALEIVPYPFETHPRSTVAYGRAESAVHPSTLLRFAWLEIVRDVAWNIQRTRNVRRTQLYRSRPQIYSLSKNSYLR